MQRQDAMDLLPPTYRRLLELREHSVDEIAIAHELDVDPDSIANLVKLADAKLRALMEQQTTRKGRQ